MSWVITGSEKTPVDPQFTSVSLLLHGNGSNGSTTITDSSRFANAVTAVGNAQISTAQSKFGGSSIRFFSGRLTAPIINLQSDFTVETWAYADSTAGSIRAIAGNWKNEQLLFAQNGSNLQLYWFPFNAGTPLLSTAGIIASQWQHLACTKQGTTFRLFIDGAIVGTATSAQSIPTSTSSFLIGAYPDVGGIAVGVYSGHLDDFRLTLGVARYTGTFTPPTAPFPDI